MHSETSQSPKSNSESVLKKMNRHTPLYRIANSVPLQISTHV